MSSLGAGAWCAHATSKYPTVSCEARPVVASLAVAVTMYLAPSLRSSPAGIVMVA